MKLIIFIATISMCAGFAAGARFSFEYYEIRAIMSEQYDKLKAEINKSEILK